MRKSIVLKILLLFFVKFTFVNHKEELLIESKIEKSQIKIFGFQKSEGCLTTFVEKLSLGKFCQNPDEDISGFGYLSESIYFEDFDNSQFTLRRKCPG